MLNPKQKRFCEEYVLDSNATQASIRAGYSERLIMQLIIKTYLNIKTIQVALLVYHGIKKERLGFLS